MKTELTDKQEKFVQGLIKGLSQREAYKAAYQNKMTDKQVDENAYKLLALPKVYQRYEILRQKAQEAAEKALMWDIEKSTAELLESLKHAKSKRTDEIGRYNAAAETAALKAIENLNKITGLEKNKLELSGNLNVKKIEDYEE